ncbi:MAG: hypothetical protein M1834_008494 [Cirrosporium novae-zelandiae]|nr:MAG: hypothetical protein M1834_008494 [Cirrosporium novae-zelandiae]
MSSLNSTESEYRGGKIIVVSIAVAIVQIMVILARFYARKFKKNPFGLDDFLIFVAFVTSLGQSALYIIMVKTGGTGYHLAVVEKHPRKLVNLQKCLYINEIMDMPFTITPAKLSILCFYLRIFFGQRFKFWVSVTGFMILGHGVGVLFAAIFQCSPIAYTWDKAIMDGTCFNQQAFYRYVSIPVIVTDVMIMILPLPFLWKLKVSTSQKIALTGVFILGSM